MNPRVNGSNWYVLVAGIPSPHEPIELAPGVHYRPLPYKLQEFDAIAAAANGFTEAWAAAGIMPLCQGEIESAADGAEVPGFDGLNRAWLATCLLVLRNHYACTAIAALNCPWKTLRTKESNNDPAVLGGVRMATEIKGLKGILIDNKVRVFRLNYPPSDEITAEDINWIRANFAAFNDLCGSSEQFKMALECCVDWRDTNNLRVAIARLWQGLESLLDVEQELSYRIAVYCASLLEPRGQARLELYREVKKMYDFRSKAVHGARIDDIKLINALSSSFVLLRRLLVYCVGLRKVPGKADLDAAVFM